MEHVDYIAARVTCAATLGALWGCLSAMYKGHIISRAVGLSAFSCAMTATACVSCERIANYIIVNNNNVYFLESSDNELKMTKEVTPSLTQTISTHAIGGFIGGGITGSLYMKRPIRGLVFMTPIMMMVGYVEYKLKEMRLNEPIDS